MYMGLLLLCVVAVAYAKPSSVEWFEVQPAAYKLSYKPYDVTWNQFKQEHGKVYKNEEEEKERQAIFMDNIQRIEEHNLLYFNDQSSYYMGVNQFTDKTEEEYKEYNKLQIHKKNPSSKFSCSKYEPPFTWELPATVDWRKKGYVTPVKDQGQCGSCWAFSATGSLEGQHFKKTGKLVSLSEQQLVDCSFSFGDHGCEGGLMDDAFAYIHSVGGLESEKDYPYKASDDHCNFNASDEVAHVKSCKDIPSGSEKALQQAVATVGPISVAIDASHESFQNYAGGVYNEPRCSSTELDHGVLVVGYGTYKGKPYWLVKNSWNIGWGMQGYIMMTRNDDNQCGIATLSSFPTD